MAEESATRDVVVVGAGPVGMSAALLLARHGIDVEVFERRTDPSDQPRAHVVNARTMELFRQWGVADAVRERALPAELATGFVWASAIDGVELATLDYIDEAHAEANSPERLCSCAQDLVEDVLRAAIEAEPNGRVSFGSEVVGYRADGGRAVVTVRDASGEHEVAARYVVAADGARSPMRDMAGVGLDRSLPLGRRVNIYFHADLAEQTRGRPYILWTIMSSATQGIFIALDGRSRWVYSVELLPGETVADYTPERAAELVRLAVGVPGLEPDIRAMLPWNVDMALAGEFARGRVFFAGDAAHQFPPMGGFGMNSGIQDAHNLAWKLAAVLRDGASPALLDTYAAERRPVAVFNAEQCMANAAAQQEAAKMMSDPDLLDLMATDAGQEIRAQFAAGVNLQQAEFHSQGQQFGYVYRSDAVVSDGTVAPPSTISEYHPSASPGARLPHLRLVDDAGASPSTVDLTGRGWLLLAGASGRPWIDAAASITDFGPAFSAYRIGDGTGQHAYRELVPGSFEAAYEVSATGAVLVRPDGHVAARWNAAVADPAAALRGVATAVLGLDRTARV